MFSGEQDFSTSIEGDVDTDDVDIDNIDTEELIKELEGDDQDNEDKSVVSTQSYEMVNGNIVEYRMEETDEGYEVVKEQK